MTSAVKFSIIGCGYISQAYINATKTFPVVSVVACADANPETAREAALKWELEALSVEALLGRADIDVVLNLTTPKAHAAVTLQALEAGKHVYLEKPFALNREEGRRVTAKAESLGLRVGCAPDTFLGAGLQTCRKLVDDGALGQIVSGTAFMMIPGHESWHPNPDFYYAEGGGPVFDMAPYYLTALVSLLGPIHKVNAVAVTPRLTRVITSQPREGEAIPVEVPTHVASTLTFCSGAVVSMVMSFDVHRHSGQPLELHGDNGSLQVPDPNTFGGPVKLSQVQQGSWHEEELVGPYTGNMRGIGAADLAYALVNGRPHRCHSDLAFHVLDVMQTLHEASAQEKSLTIASSCDRPAPLPLALTYGFLGDK